MVKRALVAGLFSLVYQTAWAQPQVCRKLWLPSLENLKSMSDDELINEVRKGYKVKRIDGIKGHAPVLLIGGKSKDSSALQALMGRSSNWVVGGITPIDNEAEFENARLHWLSGALPMKHEKPYFKVFDRMKRTKSAASLGYISLFDSKGLSELPRPHTIYESEKGLIYQPLRSGRTMKVAAALGAAQILSFSGVFYFGDIARVFYGDISGITALNGLACAVSGISSAVIAHYLPRIIGDVYSTERYRLDRLASLVWEVFTSCDDRSKPVLVLLEDRRLVDKVENQMFSVEKETADVSWHCTI